MNKLAIALMTCQSLIWLVTGYAMDSTFLLIWGSVCSGFAGAWIFDGIRL